MGRLLSKPLQRNYLLPGILIASPTAVCNCCLNLEILIWDTLYYLGNEHISCKNGQAISSYGNYCNQCKECPIFRRTYYAMTSNCSKSSNNFCPMSISSSKVCMDKVNVSSITYYCGGYTNVWNCPKANKGLNYEQCYSM